MSLEWLGYVAATLTTLAFVPQALKTIRSRASRWVFALSGSPLPRSIFPMGFFRISDTSAGPATSAQRSSWMRCPARRR